MGVCYPLGVFVIPLRILIEMPIFVTQELFNLKYICHNILNLYLFFEVFYVIKVLVSNWNLMVNFIFLLKNNMINE